jgi:hypothetical protein
MTTLRKCPFCSDTVIATVNGEHAECIKCGAMSDLEDWNTRPEEDRLRGLLDEAVDHIRHLIHIIDHGQPTIIVHDVMNNADAFNVRIAAERKE